MLDVGSSALDVHYLYVCNADFSANRTRGVPGNYGSRIERTSKAGNRSFSLMYANLWKSVLYDPQGKFA